MQRIPAPARSEPRASPLRERALATASYAKDVAVTAVVDATAWQRHTTDEDWLLWRARRTQHGWPRSRSTSSRRSGRRQARAASPTPAEQQQIEKANRTLASMPRTPGVTADISIRLREALPNRHRRDPEGDCRPPRRRAGPGEEHFYRACALAMDGFSAYVRNVARACRCLPGYEALARMVREALPRAARDLPRGNRAHVPHHGRAMVREDHV